MSLTAFLPTGAPQVLPFIGTPGVATVGYALVWSESPQGFNLAPIAVGPDQFTGVLPIAKGGTGSSTGSITGTGALAFTVGGTTNDLNLQIPKSAKVRIGSSATEGSFLVVGPVDLGYNPADLGWGNYAAIAARGVNGGNFYMQDASGNGGEFFYDSGGLRFNNITYTTPSSLRFNSGNALQPGVPDALRITPDNAVEFGRGPLAIQNITASTSTTTGSCVISGGLGVAGAIHNGGNLVSGGAKINFANLPTSDTGLADGDLWREGNTVKVKA